MAQWDLLWIIPERIHLVVRFRTIRKNQARSIPSRKRVGFIFTLLKRMERVAFRVSPFRAAGDQPQWLEHGRITKRTNAAFRVFSERNNNDRDQSAAQFLHEQLTAPGRMTCTPSRSRYRRSWNTCVFREISSNWGNARSFNGKW